LTRRLIMDLVFIVIYKSEYSIAFGGNPALMLAKSSVILICMNPLFGGTKWSLQSLTPPWGNLRSIYEYVRLHGPDPLPDDSLVRGKNKFGWIAGAWDGVMGHSWQGTDPPARGSDIVLTLGSLLNRADSRTMGALYRLIVEEPLLPSLELLIGELTESLPSLDRGRLLEVGRYFAARSGHREAVKFGLALIGLVGEPEDLDILKILGKNEEFTLYAAVAMDHVATEPEQALWELAKGVRHWGRIQTVERLKETQNTEIQAWMLREGFRNGVMDEYLACICARAGRLHEALKRQSVDDALLDGAADIIHALITGGPAEGIDDYQQSVDACEAYVNHVWSRRDLRLRHFLSVAKLQWFLSKPDGWDERGWSGWTASRRTALRATCDEILGWETWRNQIRQALASSDERAFYQGDTAAASLGIDTWEIHFRRVKAAPLTSSSWFRLMQQTDDSRISNVVSFAEGVLPLDQIETGPADEMGLGPDFRPHQALDWVLQDLRRFPGNGWRLIRAGLHSPVVRNRNMAINALALWQREAWPADATVLVLKAHELEPVDSVKHRLQDLLEGRLAV
jgi:hypothetical protein